MRYPILARVQRATTPVVLPLVLAPVHDFQTIIAAARGGAGAVYFGLDTLTMRRDVGSFVLADLGHVVASCHSYGLEAYLTTNTVVFDDEVPTLRNIATQAKRCGVDAIIVQDIAAMELAREIGIAFHVSTQCNVSNAIAAGFYAQRGASRIVLARELNLAQIREIAVNVNVELEAFVHGALCFAHSGRCGFSQFFSGKSGNRGECVQPCRRKWRLVDTSDNEIVFSEGHFFSSRDLCCIELVPDLLEVGISVLKIEGRRRGPEYVEATSRCYHEAVVAYAQGDFTPDKVKRWMADLNAVSNRGFCRGFLYGALGPSDSTMAAPIDRANRERVFLGNVVRSDKVSEQVEIALTHSELSLGEDIIIEGKEAYSRTRVDAMTVSGVSYRRAPVGARVVVGNASGNQGDKVYAWRLKQQMEEVA